MTAIQFTGTQYAATAVPNEFLDQYLPKADGDFVKIYLLLWRYYTAGRTISVTELADRLDDTERDILRGIRYWEKQQLLSCVTNEQGEITQIGFLQPENRRETSQNIKATRTSQPSEKAAPVAKKNTTHTVNAAVHKKLAVDEDFGQLVYIVGKYLNRGLLPTDSQILEYLYGELGMSAELLEYLVESCVDAGHTSLHYIEKIALDWHEKGIRTVDNAREQTELTRKQYYQILKAFGISRRGPAPEEKKIMDVWLYEYGFSMEIILEACSRTIRATHEPNFEYAGGILADWKKKKVKSSNDIAALDEAFQKKREEKAAKAAANSTGNASRNRFHNYEQTGYDYDKILASIQQ
jgi:DnaD/phage-associated family protein